MEYSVHELAKKQGSGDDFLLLDVRTKKELDIVSIPGAVHVVLQELEARLPELAEWKGKEVVCMCHHGGRSAMAQQILLANGFSDVKNLVGGIHSYAVEVDTSLATYD